MLFQGELLFRWDHLYQEYCFFRENRLASHNNQTLLSHMHPGLAGISVSPDLLFFHKLKHRPFLFFWFESERRFHGPKLSKESTGLGPVD